RYFKCYIIVSEFRQFHTLRSRAQEISTFNNVNTNRVNSTSPGDEEFKALNSMISSLTFEFDLCQFLFNESNSFLDDLNNRGEGDPIAQSISFIAGTVREKHEFQLLDLITDEYRQGERSK